MSLPIGTILENRYRIDGMLGQGGMGRIYRGFDIKLKIQVAVKENFFQTQRAILQFEQEALLLARLHHTGLPRVIDHFPFGDLQYLVMDFIDGQNLSELANQRSGVLPEKEALDYFLQICNAVHYLHQQNPPIIHRDIKPRNIIITPQGKAVLVDFGIAKVTEESDHTSTGAHGATPGFSPPEQYNGEGTGPKSDIYALGATLYVLLTGEKPPDGIALVTGQSTLEPPNTINPKISIGISKSIMHAMRSAQSERPATVASWRQELESSMENHSEGLTIKIAGALSADTDAKTITLTQPESATDWNRHPLAFGGSHDTPRRFLSWKHQLERIWNQFFPKPLGKKKRGNKKKRVRKKTNIAQQAKMGMESEMAEAVMWGVGCLVVLAFILVVLYLLFNFIISVLAVLFGPVDSPVPNFDTNVGTKADSTVSDTVQYEGAKNNTVPLIDSAKIPVTSRKNPAELDSLNPSDSEGFLKENSDDIQTEGEASENSNNVGTEKTNSDSTNVPIDSGWPW